MQAADHLHDEDRCSDGSTEDHYSMPALAASSDDDEPYWVGTHTLEDINVELETAWLHLHLPAVGGGHPAEHLVFLDDSVLLGAGIGQQPGPGQQYEPPVAALNEVYQEGVDMRDEWLLRGGGANIDPAVLHFLPPHFGEVRLDENCPEDFVDTCRLMFAIPHEALAPLDTRPDQVEQGVWIEKWARVPDGRVYHGWQVGTGAPAPTARTTQEWTSTTDIDAYIEEKRRVTAAYGPSVFGLYGRHNDSPAEELRAATSESQRDFDNPANQPLLQRETMAPGSGDPGHVHGHNAAPAAVATTGDQEPAAGTAIGIHGIDLEEAYHCCILERFG
jgi:hypothetical protein